MSVDEAQIMSQISERLAVVIEQTKHTATKEDLGAVKNEILKMLISHQQSTFGWIMGAYGMVVASVIVNHLWK